jgi:hypothetical protein
MEMIKMHKLESLVLVTSNKQKLKEYQDMGLPFSVSEGQDLPEIIADPLTVALYKAKAAGKNRLVEDTILMINGEEVIDIRWRIKELANYTEENPEIKWVVTLGYNTGEFIQLYQGVVECEIVSDVDVNNIPLDAVAFDPYLRPKGESRSFYQLWKDGVKASFSPRTIAAQMLLNEDVVMSESVDAIPEWKGCYQS